jgi:hypothetical protein
LPNAKQNISLSPRLTLNYAEVGYYGALDQLAAVMNPLSKSIIADPGYPGVSINYDGVTVTATDFTGPPNPAKAIAYQDLIGQPIWIRPPAIQIKVVMRAELNLFDLVTLPPGQQTTTAGTLSRFRDKTAFTGNYNVQSIHHYGNFSSPILPSGVL